MAGRSPFGDDARSSGDGSLSRSSPPHPGRPPDALDPLPVDEAIRLYLDHRQDDLRARSFRKHETTLDYFQAFADQADFQSMHEVGGRELLGFKNWRKQQADLKKVSVNGNLAVIRTFLGFCASIEAVPADLPDRVPMANVSVDEAVCDDVPDDDFVAAVRDYCATYEYASRVHLVVELLCEIGLRIGSIRAIDLADVDRDARTIHLHDRPGGATDTDTPLKNGSAAERIVNYPDTLDDVIGDYCSSRGARHDVTDSADRQPLLTSTRGRPAVTTLRRDLYKVTRPCVFAGECPAERAPDDCEATAAANAHACPENYSAHPFRKWAIMHQLDQGMPKELLSDRVDVSVPVLEKHYDHRSAERKSDHRRAALADQMDHYEARD